MKNKKSNSITCSCEDPPVPFGLILSIAHNLDIKDYQYCSDKLISWMLKDSDLITADGWIEFEAQGHPVWWRAARLIEYLSIKLQDYSIDKIIYIIKTPYFPMADFITIILINRFCSNIDFEIKINSEIQSNEYLDILKEKVVNLCIQVQELDTLYPEISELYNDPLIKLTGFSASEWHLINSNNNVTIEPGIIIKSIWRYQQLGNPDIPEYLIANIIKNNNNPRFIGMLDGASMQIQMINHQYAKIAANSDPIWLQYLSPNLKRNFYFSKAYAATLTRNIDLAEDYFSYLNIDKINNPHNLDDLYLLNIYALFLFTKKEINKSLQVERKIEKFIICNNLYEKKINYINLINTARLYRIVKDYEKSQSYYDKAYKVIHNSMNSSDYIYRSMNYAKLFYSATKYQESLSEWMTSAIYWVSLKAPEELAMRPICAILNDHSRDIFSPISLEEIAKNYLRNIIICFNKYIKENKIIFKWNEINKPEEDLGFISILREIININNESNKSNILTELQINKIVDGTNYKSLLSIINKVLPK